MTGPSPSASSTLVRALGRWSLAAIILNIVIGASAFGVPGEIASLIGKYGPWAFLIGGLFMLTVGACFAEVASYFDQTGGPYLYARKAYGPFVGICIAWLMCLVRISSIAAIGCTPRILARLQHTRSNPLSGNVWALVLSRASVERKIRYIPVWCPRRDSNPHVLANI